MRSSRDGVRVTVRALLYETRSVIIRPGRDSVVRIVLTAMDLNSLSPVYTGDPPPRTVAVRQPDRFVVRGVVMNTSRQLVEGEIQSRRRVAANSYRFAWRVSFGPVES